MAVSAITPLQNWSESNTAEVGSFSGEKKNKNKIKIIQWKSIRSFYSPTGFTQLLGVRFLILFFPPQNILSTKSEWCNKCFWGITDHGVTKCFLQQLSIHLHTTLSTLLLSKIFASYEYTVKNVCDFDGKHSLKMLL